MDASLPLPRRSASDRSGDPSGRPVTGPGSATDAVDVRTALLGAADVAVAVLDLAAADLGAADLGAANLGAAEPGPAGPVRVLDLTPAFARWAGAELRPGDALTHRLLRVLPLAQARAAGSAGVVVPEGAPGGGPLQVHVSLVGSSSALVVLVPAAREVVQAGSLDELPGPRELVRRLADRTASARSAAGTVVLHVRLRRSAGGTPVPVTMLDPIVQRLQASLRAEDLLVRWAPRTLGLLLAVPPGREEQVAESVRGRLLAGPGGDLLEVRTADRAALLSTAGREASRPHR